MSKLLSVVSIHFHYEIIIYLDGKKRTVPISIYITVYIHIYSDVAYIEICAEANPIYL